LKSRCTNSRLDLTPGYDERLSRGRGNERSEYISHGERCLSLTLRLILILPSFSFVAIKAKPSRRAERRSSSLRVRSSFFFFFLSRFLSFGEFRAAQ